MMQIATTFGKLEYLESDDSVLATIQGIPYKFSQDEFESIINLICTCAMSYNFRIKFRPDFEFESFIELDENQEICARLFTINKGIPNVLDNWIRDSTLLLELIQQGTVADEIQIDCVTNFDKY